MGSRDGFTADLAIEGNEADLIEQINDKIATCTDEGERRVLRICKEFLPGMTRALLNERDRGIDPEDVVNLVCQITHSTLATLSSTITAGDEQTAAKLQALVISLIRQRMARGG
jgi:hypothetical protein